MSTTTLRCKRRGIAAVLAMLFLVIMGVLSIAMYQISSLNTRTVYNSVDMDRARLAAESGLQWMAYRLQVLNKPRPLSNVDSSMAYNSLWGGYNEPSGASIPGLGAAIQTDLQQITSPAAVTATLSTVGGNHSVDSSPIYLTSNTTVGPRFSINVLQDPTDGRILYVTSLGQSGNARRAVQMQFWISKEIPYSVIGRVPIQVGKNVLIDGSVAMMTTQYSNTTNPETGAGGWTQPGVQVYSDFKYSSGQKATFQAFQDWMQANYTGGLCNGLDNCISTKDPNNAALVTAAHAAGYDDLNGDGRIDEYDVFLKTQGITKSNGVILQNGQPVDSAKGPDFTISSMTTLNASDPYLLANIDRLHAPLSYDPTNSSTAVTSGGFLDGHINNLDNYAKIYGQLKVATPSGINADVLQGPIVSPDPSKPAVVTSFTGDEQTLNNNLIPAAFEQACASLAAVAGTGTSVVRSNHTISNTTLTLADQSVGDDPTTRSYGPYELLQIADAGLKYRTNSNGQYLNASGQVVSSKTQAAQVPILTSGVGTISTIGSGSSADYATNRASVQATVDNANAAVTSTNIIRAAATNSKSYAIERNFYGALSNQVTLKRPVYRNISFNNVVIPKGLNPLFINCTFNGVTYVQTDKDLAGNGTLYPASDSAQSSNNSASSNWCDTITAGGSGKISTTTNVVVPTVAGAPGTSGGPSLVTNEAITNGSTQGNNVRFDGCTFAGPVVGNYANAYARWANEWQFTGTTVISNSSTGNDSDKVTFCAPQTAVQMGSLATAEDTTVAMKGVVVLGNLDVRATGYIDGACIVTGLGAGNSTLGFFGNGGPTDGTLNAVYASNRTAGRLIFRYNPRRALPYGVAIQVRILPDLTTYTEVKL